MKSLNSVTAIAIAVTLVTLGAGCKKTPKNLTHLPRNAGPLVGSQNDGRIALPGGQTGPGDQSGRITDLTGPGGNNTTTANLTEDQRNTQTNRPEGAEDKVTLAPQTVYFDYDRSTVKGSEVSKVQQVASFLKSESSAFVRVEGNCDERGTEEYNRSLGERRALAVRELLVASGIAPDRVATTTYGEDQPAVAGHDESAWSKNRRADFVVIRPTAGGAPALR